MSLLPPTTDKEGKVVDMDGLPFVIVVSFELGMAVVDGTETRAEVEATVDNISDIAVSVLYVEFPSVLEDASNVVGC